MPGAKPKTKSKSGAGAKAPAPVTVPSWGKLTPDVQARMVTAVGAGNFYTDAARYAGISAATVHRWIERGKGHRDEQDRLDAEAEETGADPELLPHSPYRDFYEAITRARAEAETRAITLINVAAETDWKAAAWWVQKINRRWRDDATQVELVGSGGGPIQHVVDGAAEPLLSQSQRMALVLQGMVAAGKLAPAALDLVVERPDEGEDS